MFYVIFTFDHYHNAYFISTIYTLVVAALVYVIQHV